MRKLFLAASAVALATSTPVFANANSDLKSLVDAYWADVLKEAPVFASSLGSILMPTKWVITAWQLLTDGRLQLGRFSNG
jgi:hypothetical protein